MISLLYCTRIESAHAERVEVQKTNFLTGISEDEDPETVQILGRGLLTLKPGCQFVSDSAYLAAPGDNKTTTRAPFKVPKYNVTLPTVHFIAYTLLLFVHFIAYILMLTLTIHFIAYGERN